MTLHCTENQQALVKSENRTRAVYTAVCTANHLAKNNKIIYFIVNPITLDVYKSPPMVLTCSGTRRISGV